MKIALIGYGKMGKTIERIAKERGHTVSVIIDEHNKADFDSPVFRDSDVAIEFTTPESAPRNYKKCFEANVPVVSGTTGWLEHLDEVKAACKEGGHTFFYASNFSLGVNLFFALNEHLARVMNRFPEYNVRMEEVHHIHKLDAPSGTAITLAEGITENVERKTAWCLEKESLPTDIAIHCVRQDEVPGMHEVVYESAVDTISIKHDAKNREGLALGAVMAAEFAYNKKGFLGMKDMLKF
ncbi:4-hydroxy-tetrahydrodipicolinate reductase [Dysgonomonas sp. PH5-45]|uniref:4-hydroxy-tetrahydrodipicolinate reductase n=1 Tax=unclassified Dysgonomonas TaxID=2630389 RepID=UPI002475614C|nr:MULTISPECIES: 4-hydroxy-tetrahydrodipicolinate reductase [unclassified Dysgonomonas]MDH6353699.1 4-hydroxy-tetrahydrodipicolinate reductase [Dysgonomonas sp. PH5-45]MDH6386602.1 4-hydroxy-tetrahydrodipicolinate reductase [Dysgonomonas sp. PH5-37]